MLKPSGRLLPLLMTLLWATLCCLPLGAQAWRDALCSRSALAEGYWVKVRVPSSGIYRITYADLRKMGFPRPENVQVYGYGGYLLSQEFASLPPADLPPAPTLHHADGLLFYARGTVAWNPDEASATFRHERNFYSDAAYYFLGERTVSDTVSMTPLKEPLLTSAATPLTVFDEYQLYEHDAYSWGNTGRHLYDDYDYVNGESKNYTFSLPGIQAEQPADITVAFAAKSVGNKTIIRLSTAGEELARSLLPAVQSGNQYYVKATSTLLHADWKGEKSETATFTLTHDRPSGVSGRLDYIALHYRRRLELTDSYLAFRSLQSVGHETAFSISRATSSTIVWDVTHSGEWRQMEGSYADGTFTFAIPAGTLREFVAINPDATNFPSVEVVGNVANQNLHGMSGVEMVIITPDRTDLQAEADRLAEAHRTRDGLSVSVVSASEIYNEFSSGTPDATAYRRLMKMLFDRASQGGVKPRYLLFFGDCSYDNRMLTASWKSFSPENFLLSFQSENSLEETASYITDDYYGFLADEEGDNLSEARLALGIGRFPVRTATQAADAVDKTIAYMQNRHAGDWKQRICFVADDGDEHLHLSQAEQLATYTETHHPALQVTRLYADAYRREASATGYTYPEATNRLLHHFEQGMLVVNYTGHGSTSAWAAENLLTTGDIQALTSPRLPLWITATCDFTRFDDAETSAGEEAFLNAKGGAIALLTTTRAVYASQNAALNQAFMSRLFTRPEGQRLRLGDIVRLSKCDETLAADRNKLNFALVGDPALTLAYPEYGVQIDEFAGYSTSGLTSLPQIKAGQMVTVKGRVLTEEGVTAEAFDGLLSPTLYDSREQVSTLNNLGEGAYKYTERSRVLFAGSDSVRQGHFEFSFRVPLDINYSDETGMLHLYASDNRRGDEAGGVFEAFTVGGTDDGWLTTDTLGPQMRLYLNTPQFKSGGKTHETPLFVAELEDKAGINTVGSGVGHDLMLSVDGSPVLTYVLNDYYTPATGDYTRGTVRFTLPELTEGKHTLTFRAWNLLNRSNTQTLDFEVVRGLSPKLVTVKCLQTPARTSTTFLLSHNRTGSVMKVRLFVYDFAGRLVWTHEEKAASSDEHYYVEWDLCSNSGQRLSPGVYLYRASVVSGEGKESSKAQKLLILAQ